MTEGKDPKTKKSCFTEAGARFGSRETFSSNMHKLCMYFPFIDVTAKIRPESEMMMA